MIVRVEHLFIFYHLNAAVGCTDLVPPEDAWIKREDDKIIIGCYTSRQTWQLRCQDGRWLGVVSNCTQGTHYCVFLLYKCSDFHTIGFHRLSVWPNGYGLK